MTKPKLVSGPARYSTEELTAEWFLLKNMIRPSCTLLSHSIIYISKHKAALLGAQQNPLHWQMRSSWQIDLRGLNFFIMPSRKPMTSCEDENFADAGMNWWQQNRGECALIRFT